MNWKNAGRGVNVLTRGKDTQKRFVGNKRLLLSNKS